MNSRHRLRRAADIARVRARGRLWRNPYLWLYADTGGTGDSRVALVVSRKLGSAVHRNRLRRRLRAALRSRLPALEPALDMVVIARARARDAGFQRVNQAAADILAQCVSGRSAVPA